jgi:Raf kinase inhibitor-like YbhB/YbcL family protein
MAFTLTSSAFCSDQAIPAQYTCDSTGQSPELTWTDAPAETQSFVLILHDLDAPQGDFTYWIQFDIPKNVHNLAEGCGDNATGISGQNDFGNMGYGGPCPPPGHGPHRYIFTLYALDAPTLGLLPKTRRSDVEAAIRGHVLAQAQLVGLYERQPMDHKGRLGELRPEESGSSPANMPDPNDLIKVSKTKKGVSEPFT